MRKKLFTFFAIALCCAGSSYAEAIYGEKCGENVDWVFYDGSGYLYLSGSGDMYDYTSSSKVPWYNYRDQITNVVFESGSSITSIGSYAFSHCSNMTSITIPNSVTSIGEAAFEICSSLTSVTIPNGVTSIGEVAFFRCSSLASVTIPNSVKSIGNSAFYICSSLTSVTIPNSVKSIGNSAFYSCSSLTSVTIPNSVTSIGQSAFNGCSSLTSINVADDNPNYCSIDGVLFDKAQTILIQYPAGKTNDTYTIPNSVTSIGEDAFSDCSSLTSVTIGNSVTSIGDYAFYKCSGLTSVTIPNSVISIGDYAFFYCSSLTSVTIPNSVTSIGDYVFHECGLTQITTLAQTPPEATYNSFEGVDLTIPVYVPAGTLSAYKAATGWSEFTNIQEDASMGIEDIRIQPSTTASQKILHDGILYILRPDGKVYNAQGTEL